MERIIDLEIPARHLFAVVTPVLWPVFAGYFCPFSQFRRIESPSVAFTVNSCVVAVASSEMLDCNQTYTVSKLMNLAQLLRRDPV